MFNVNIKENIQARYATFSDQEKRIATFLLMKESQRIANISVAQLAKATNTTPAVVIRFVSKMGLSSFNELKLKVSTQTQASTDPTLQKVAQKNSIQGEVEDYYASLVKSTERMTADADLKRALKLILKTPRIYLYGVGSSGLTAAEFGQRLLQMGLSASVISDTHMMLANSLVLRKTDLVIGIRFLGRPKKSGTRYRSPRKIKRKSLFSPDRPTAGLLNWRMRASTGIIRVSSAMRVSSTPNWLFCTKSTCFRQCC